MSAESDSKALQSIAKQKEYVRSAEVVPLCDDLQKLRELDKHSESGQLKNGLIAAACFLGIAGGAITALSDAPLLGVPVALASIVGFIVFLTKSIRSAATNVQDHRYLLAEGLLELFGRDMEESASASLKLSFKNGCTKENLVRKAKDRTIYRHGWLTLSGAFADGSKYSLRLAEITHIKFRKGKIKPKGFILSLTMAFSKKSYGELKLNQDNAVRLVQLPMGASLKSCRIKGNVLHLSAKLSPPVWGTKEEARAQLLTQAATFLLLSAYEILNSTRRATEASAS